MEATQTTIALGMKLKSNLGYGTFIVTGIENSVLGRWIAVREDCLETGDVARLIRQREVNAGDWVALSA